MYYRIEIATDNGAFSPELGPELARILRKLAYRIECSDEDGLASTLRLLDYNGNAVGSAVLSES